MNKLMETIYFKRREIIQLKEKEVKEKTKYTKQKTLAFFSAIGAIFLIPHLSPFFNFSDDILGYTMMLLASMYFAFNTFIDFKQYKCQKNLELVKKELISLQKEMRLSEEKEINV